MEKDKRHVVVLTGAGVSAESGLKTFRDSDGLWEGHAIGDVATPAAWRRNPQLVLDFYNMRRRDVLKAEPNAAHRSLAALEAHFDVTIVTQNVDDLHERAGSTRVVHLHGEILKMRSERNESLVYDIREDMLPGQLAEDGGRLRPHIVWFEEAVPMIPHAAALMQEADVFILVGSSLQVYPAAGLIDFVPRSAPKYIVDKRIPEVGGYDNLVLIERPATEGMGEVWKRLVKD